RGDVSLPRCVCEVLADAAGTAAPRTAPGRAQPRRPGRGGAVSETIPGGLEGLKVADFSWAAAGPIATRHLADHGATVVRVESSAHVDSTRITGPFRDDKAGLNKSGFYADFNSSKYD